MPNISRHPFLLGSLLLASACGGSKAQQTQSHAPGYPVSAAESYSEVASSMDDSTSAHRERYASIEENEPQETVAEAVSTFSIDVDTASYANVRRFLRGGALPPANAVRIEEMVNYFQYDYEGPTSNQPFAIHTELSTAPWAVNHQLLKIGVQGLRIDNSALPKRNLVFLIDVSGSMSSHNKLPLLKEGFEMLVKTMREEDRVAIVVYAGAAGAVLLPTSGADQESILAAIDKLQSGGSTNGAQGIELAYALAEQSFDEDAINRVILASDGDFNVGMTSQEALAKLIAKKRASGVYLSVLGFGDGNLNDATMEMLADTGNGNYSYIDSAMEAKKVLVDEGGSTLVTIAKDVKIQVEFNPDAVKSYRLIGYENRMMSNEDFDNDTADAGELGPGHSVTALYEIETSAASRNQKLVELRLRYKLPRETESKLIVHEVENQIRDFEVASEDLRFASAVAGFGLLLKDSAHKGDLNWSRLQAMAQRAVASDASPHRLEFLELVGIARRLAGGDQAIAK